MKQVKSIEEVECHNSDEGKDFVITLNDKTSSTVHFLKDAGEWVMQDEEPQRFSQSELQAILTTVTALNKEGKGKKTKSKKAKKSRVKKSKKKRN
jgi:hypothetical protein